MSYDDIRAALHRGFHLDNLWHVTHLGFGLLNSEHVTHPAVPFAIATTAEKIATRWTGHALPVDTAQVVEAHMLPKLLALLDVADSDAATVTGALDDVARAYAEAIPIIDDVL